MLRNLFIVVLKNNIDLLNLMETVINGTFFDKNDYEKTLIDAFDEQKEVKNKIILINQLQNSNNEFMKILLALEKDLNLFDKIKI